MKIGLLIGGESAERDVSLSSGKSIEKALISLGHKVVKLDPIDGFASIEDSILNVDLVFNGLHGGDGENGKIAAQLQSLNVIYTGSNEQSSRICMDKNLSKKTIAENDINTPKWILKNDTSSDILDGNFEYPLIVKPNDQGSTIGLSIVKRKDQLKDAFTNALQFADSIIFESYIDGREITVPIVGSKAYPVIEIIPSHDFYDYECKYTKGMSQYICPAEISNKLSESIKDLAFKIHTILGCRHYSRVDFLLDSKNEPWFLELNTLPGMTETSLLPKSLKADGIEFKEIIQMILNEALRA
jgi:D-alanine-D-alanine ligase